MILSNYITFLFLSILTIGFLLPENIKACCQVCPEDFYDELSFLEEISVQDKLHAVNKFHKEHGIAIIPKSKQAEFAHYLNNRKLEVIATSSDSKVYNNINYVNSKLNSQDRKQHLVQAFIETQSKKGGKGGKQTQTNGKSKGKGGGKGGKKKKGSKGGKSRIQVKGQVSTATAQAVGNVKNSLPVPSTLQGLDFQQGKECCPICSWNYLPPKDYRNIPDPPGAYITRGLSSNAFLETASKKGGKGGKKQKGEKKKKKGKGGGSSKKTATTIKPPTNTKPIKPIKPQKPQKPLAPLNAPVVSDCCDVCIAQQYAPRDFMDVNEFLEISEQEEVDEENDNDEKQNVLPSFLETKSKKGGKGGKGKSKPKKTSKSSKKGSNKAKKSASKTAKSTKKSASKTAKGTKKSSNNGSKKSKGGKSKKGSKGTKSGKGGKGGGSVKTKAMPVGPPSLPPGPNGVASKTPSEYRGIKKALCGCRLCSQRMTGDADIFETQKSFHSEVLAVPRNEANKRAYP
jgi:hypothetical protein